MNNEETLDFSYIFSTIRKRILLIILMVILGGVAAIVYNRISPVLYESKTTLYVVPQESNDSVSYDSVLSSQRLVKTYTELLKSRKIVGQVKSNLKLKESIQTLSSSISISPIVDTQIITISVETKNAVKSKNIANEVATVFIKEINKEMKTSQVNIMDNAVVNKTAVSPRIALNIALGITAGLFIGIFISFLVEAMDKKIKNHEDIKKYLKLQTLGIIPHHSIENDVVDGKGRTNSANKADIRIINQPTSVVSESLRMLRTNLNFMDLKVINFTSTLPSEGKTEIVSNIAASFAMLGKKVLVIDCDLRKPKIHKKFDLYRGEGVSDIILSEHPKKIADVVQSFKIPNGTTLDILPAGSKVSNPSELINNKKFQEIVAQARENYDLVLIDCPPISMITDGILVSKLSDGTVYVIESDRVDYQVVTSCVEQLQNNKAFLLGVVLTKVNIKHQKRLYGYKYDYYTSNYQ